MEKSTKCCFFLHSVDGIWGLKEADMCTSLLEKIELTAGEIPLELCRFSKPANIFRAGMAEFATSCLSFLARPFLEYLAISV